MPNIVIKEIDETGIGSNVASTDVAYVPGFADTNSGVYILNEAGKTPDTLDGTAAGDKDDYNTHGTLPCFACNIVDKITWKCTASGTPATWEKQDLYIEPAPENVPVLCSTISEFELNFGLKPYKWVKGYNADESIESDEDFAARRKNPVFTAAAGAPEYAYAEGDFEKSYIYAKELINLGVPVLYENACSRDENGFKELPSVTELYTSLSTRYSELLDKGEYSVKYITSGAYPTFEYTGGSRYEEDASDTGDFAFASGGNASLDVATPNCCADFHGLTGVHPSRLVINVTYTPEGSSTSVSTQIVVTDAAPYEETGANGWGGIGNTITLTSTGFTITYADTTDTEGWKWDSATYIASVTKSVVDGGSGTGTELAQKMISIAQERGDAVAFIDHTNNPARALTGGTSVYDVIKSINSDSGFTDGEFGALFTPWASYTTVKEASDVPATQIMPASFGYLLSLGKSLRNNPNWLAVAGVARGLVPYIQSLNTVQRLSNTIADAYQPRDNVAINPITNIKPYGLTIWGNRTLKKNVGNITATAMLNIRNLVSDVKKVAYTAAKSLMFEQNSDVLWVNFKSYITPLLDQMLSGQGLSGYKVIRGVTTEKAKVVANIKLYPLYAVESFEITVVISDEEVSVS